MLTNLSHLSSLCGTEYSQTDYNQVNNYKYICDGLLVSIIGCFGVVGKSRLGVSEIRFNASFGIQKWTSNWCKSI